MSANPMPSAPPDPVLEQAIAWLVQLRAQPSGVAPDPALQARIDAWRAADGRHESVWSELMASEAQFQRLVALPVAPAQWQQPLSALNRSRSRRQSRRRWLGGVALGLGSVALAGLAARQAGLFDSLAGQRYATGTGDQRRVTLGDGTQLALNTATAVRLQFDAQQRLIALEHGEIFIDTGRDALSPRHRPFLVQTAQARLQALGTRFAVRQQEGVTRLSVLEGRVAVDPGQGTRTVIVPGETVEIDAGGNLRRQATVAATMDPTAWLDGTLVARDMRLGDVVAEMARYRHGWLVCEDSVASLKVSGVFQLRDGDAALESLAQALPVRIEQRTRFWVRVTALNSR
ncbi:FecR family protein [Herbaspirillum huttiense F1]|uniref:FecR family protein n=1 Tax=Herbaspirillum huttiense subsp. lycopersici TaxID=3074428 RepID=A0ABU2EIP4_9BURK|nr:FecR family protein [Herbaspirillum huttiense]MDR9847758.1 FecR family protein [Herbaspirillum huttiense SE1]MDT0355234.1 FecR family protein [Herbaspirillum huttiense F1]